jgi:hypothetical protein
VLVGRGKGGKRREVGIDRWGWDQLEPWIGARAALPVGALFCVLRGPTRGRACSPTGIRAQLRNVASAAGVRRRFAPPQLPHPHAVEISPRGRRWARLRAHRVPQSNRSVRSHERHSDDRKSIIPAALGRRVTLLA